MKKKIIISLCLLAGISVYGATQMRSIDLGSIKDSVKDTDRKTSDNMQKRNEAAENSKDERKELEELYHTMYRYMLAKDVKRLSAMLTDDFVLIHMTGMRQPKLEYLRCISEGELHYFTEETDHIYIDIHGDEAVMTGQSRVNAAVFGGSRHTWPLQLVIDMKKQDGKWMMTDTKASTY